MRVTTGSSASSSQMARGACPARSCGSAFCEGLASTTREVWRDEVDVEDVVGGQDEGEKTGGRLISSRRRLRQFELRLSQRVDASISHVIRVSADPGFPYMASVLVGSDRR